MGSQGERLTPATPSLSDSFPAAVMDAIRKKMQSLKSETDSLYSIIHNFEEETKEANRRSDQADCDIRDYGKKVHGLEIEFDETCDKLATTSKEADNILKKVKAVESTCMNNEVTLEELDKNLRASTKMAA